jgi:hypothetical protein
MQLSQVTSQPLSDLVATYFLCKGCGIVDRDHARMRKGHPCSACSLPGESGLLAFPIHIHVLADLVQQAFHSDSPTRPVAGPSAVDVGTVLMFCSLRESLLTHFLVNNLRTRGIDPPLIDKLMDDNRLANQKFGDLFTSVVGQKWGAAVGALSDKHSTDFVAVSDLMKDAAERRNEFLHQGTAWGLEREFAVRCIDSTGDMMSLFAALHNEFTAPRFRARRSP